MNMTHYNILSTLLNTTFGSGSSKGGERSVKAEFVGDNLVFTFTSVVHFAEERSLQMQVDRLADESVQVLKDGLTTLKSAFKEAAGVSLKTKDVKSSDNIELVSAMSQRKVAYYRRSHVVEISV
tara:strand:+ start:390 stop:761 length:372 start_codon:yes stop_codon:yes gene_type:complete